MSRTTQQHRSHTKIILIAGAAALGGFLFGFDTAVINGAVDALKSSFNLSAGLTGFVVSSALLGCVVGAWFSGPIANKYGRIRVMVIAAVLFAASGVGSGLAFGAGDFIIWRIVGGMGIGAASVIGPAYISEVSPTHIRGRLVSIQALAGVTGIAVALFSDSMLAAWANGAGEILWLGLEAWRWMFLVGSIPAVVYLGTSLRIPESPRFLVAVGKAQEAAIVLREYTKVADVERKIADIKDSLAADHKVRLSDIRGKAWGLAPIVWVGMALAAFQQFVGINVIFYYSTTLWKSVGFGESEAFLITTLTSLVNIAVTVVSMALIDRIGRRPLLLMGSIGMAVSLGTMALCFATANHTLTGAVELTGIWGPVALVAANLFVVFFGMTWGPVMWVMLGEMFPNRIRASAMAVTVSVNWVANFAVSASFPAMAAFSLSWSYGLYALCALISFFVVKHWVRETNAVDLESM